MPNSTSIATPVPCQQCRKILSSKRNLRRHEQKVHKILPPPPPQTVCDECLESFESLSEAREHVELVHDMTSNSHCIYCHTIFLTAESYGQHLLKKHALPVWDGIETTSSAAPTESAFRGKLRRYDLKVGEKEMDLLQVMMQNKEEIDALILERVKEGPNKVQFHVEVGMIKIPTVQDGDSGNFERTMLFLNTKTLTVYFEGIAGVQFLELIEHMVNQVNSFSSHGSGWIIDRIEKLQISFAAFSPIRAGSYLELPDALSAASTLLTNINTKDDDRCFLYSFVAAYHNVNEPALYPTSRRWLEKNKVSTYNLDKEGIVKINGEYEMPMGLMDMDRFEKLNNCQINVFR